MHRWVALLGVLAAAGFALAAPTGPWVIPADEAGKYVHPIAQADRAASAQRGNAVFTKLCITCHGAEGKGDTPTAKALKPPPPDFASAAVQSQSDGALFVKITRGRPPMSGYERFVSEAERWDLVSYIRTLAHPPAPRAP